MMQNPKWTALYKKNPERVIFCLIFIMAAIYYGWRLFALTPWYDELYTYYYFVSRGPIYAAIHWPLPNNHVGYSVLSAFLDFFGSPAIGLRGISYISSLLSLWLLYWIGENCFSKGVALLPPCLFASMSLINLLAVQGRGYALSACLYLSAFCCLWKIIVVKDKKFRYYILFGTALVWSLYTLASNVYFVLPLCASGGIVLLCQKRFREFWKLVGVSLCSAACTVGLYGVIWLAVGSNLLGKTEGGAYFGMGHVQIILHAPFTAAKTGIDYMLGMPYIQSVAREGYLLRLGSYIRTLFGLYYNGLAYVLMGIVLIGLAASVWRLVSWYRKCRSDQVQEKEQDANFMEWYLLISFLMTPVMLIIQSALPYYRVFSYFGVAIALMCTWFVSLCIEMAVHKFGRNSKRISGMISLIVYLFFVKTLFFPLEDTPYGSRETAVEEAYRTVNISDYERIAVADCDQEYLLKYLYGLDIENDNGVRLTRTIEDADCVLLDRDLLLPEEQFIMKDSAGDEWKFYVTKDTLPVEYLEEHMQAVYENARFVFYVKR